MNPATFVGTTPSYLTAHNYSVEAGTSFTTAEVSRTQARRRDRARPFGSELFAGQSAVGKTIQVNGASYEVIGVTASKGSNGRPDQDDIVFAPITDRAGHADRLRPDQLDHRRGDESRIVA